jgi:predicted aldo/keto reductase-like oxidoreductase
LALTGDQMAADHYQALSVKASACVQCGHCEKACPFHVGQMARMKEIAQYFGEEIL